MGISNREDFIGDLNSLDKLSFPKVCRTCGKVYNSPSEYINYTVANNTPFNGFKQYTDDAGISALEVFRNCECGSTLLEFFSDRRDNTKTGRLRRAKFASLMKQLNSHGYESEEARTAILEALNGKPMKIKNMLNNKQAS